MFWVISDILKSISSIYLIAFVMSVFDSTFLLSVVGIT
jgi:hypothetical protein